PRPGQHGPGRADREEFPRRQVGHRVILERRRVHGASRATRPEDAPLPERGHELAEHRPERPRVVERDLHRRPQRGICHPPIVERVTVHGLSRLRTRSRLGPVTDIGLWTIAAQTPDRPAVIEPDGTVVSYAELAARADQAGRGLQALGLRPGDCVAGMLPNSSAVLALFFAAMETGLYVVPVNWHLAAAEVAYILGDSGAAAFVADERVAAVVQAGAEQA